MPVILMEPIKASSVTIHIIRRVLRRSKLTLFSLHYSTVTVCLEALYCNKINNTWKNWIDKENVI